MSCCPNEHRCGCNDTPCPDCGGTGRIQGHYADTSSDLECPTCTPTQEDIEAMERTLEAQRGQADIARRYWNQPDPRRAK